MELLFSFLQPFLPPFFGVLTAFLVERLWHRYSNRKERQKLLQDLKKELESCSKLLVGEGNLCPRDMWLSGVSSGLVRLIPTEPRNELASLYFKIESHNYEAEKVRDVSILSASDKGKPQDLIMIKPVMKESPAAFLTHTEMLHYQLSKRLIDSEKKLREDIESLLKKLKWK